MMSQLDLGLSFALMIVIIFIGLFIMYLSFLVYIDRRIKKELEQYTIDLEEIKEIIEEDSEE